MGLGFWRKSWITRTCTSPTFFRDHQVLCIFMIQLLETFILSSLVSVDMTTRKGSTKNRANNGNRDLSGTVFWWEKWKHSEDSHGMFHKKIEIFCKRWETTRTSHVISALEVLYFLDALSCFVKYPWSPQKSSHTFILPVESQIESNNEYLCKCSLNRKFLWISWMQFL